MKTLLITSAAMLIASSAFALDLTTNTNTNLNNNQNTNVNGNVNSNVNRNNSRADSHSSSSVSNSIKNRLQPGNVSSFGGGVCPEGFSISVPGGGFTAQVQCKEGKQAMKAATVDTYFNRKATRDWLCQTDKELYSLDHCVQRRIIKSGVVQRRDRAKYGK